MYERYVSSTTALFDEDIRTDENRQLCAMY